MEAREENQRLIDWEKTGRDLAALEEHCRLAGLPQSDISLLICLAELGHVDERGNSFWYLSLREAANRSEILSAELRRLGDVTTDDGRRWLQLAAQANLSPGGISKSIARLGRKRKEARLPELVRYDDALDGTRRCKRLIVSWKRVWRLKTWGEGQRFRALPRASSALPRPQEQERIINPPDPRNQEPRTKNIPVTNPVDQPEALEIDDWHQRSVEALAKRILNRIAPVEAKHRVGDDDRLNWHTARRIAMGICDDSETGTGDELERIFGSMARQETFRRSPAAYLSQAAKRRGWLPARQIK